MILVEDRDTEDMEMDRRENTKRGSGKTMEREREGEREMGGRGERETSVEGRGGEGREKGERLMAKRVREITNGSFKLNCCSSSKAK